MANKAPKVKHRFNIEMSDEDGNLYSGGWGSTRVEETADNCVFMRVPVSKTKVGDTLTTIITVEYLGEKQYKQTYQQRVKAMAASEKRREAWDKRHAQEELERQERELIQRRARIMNQIELAFVKKGKDAVNFVTCDKCDAMAKFLGLAYENPGSSVVDPDQITGGWCEEHNYPHQRPFKTKASIACERLEFFYDGLRQIYVKGK